MRGSAVAEGGGTSAVAPQVGVSRPTVIKWRDRFVAHGVAGLKDEERSGRPKTVDEASSIATTLEPPPAKLGVTHWSSRMLGRHLGIGDATVARAWRKYGVRPWRRETFKFSTDPRARGKGSRRRRALPQAQLEGAIRTFIDGWNNRCHPFIWIKTADEILPHATRKPTSDA